MAPKCAQHRSQDAPKPQKPLKTDPKWIPKSTTIDENLDFMKKWKTFKNNVLPSCFTGSTLWKSWLFQPSELKKTGLKQDLSKIDSKVTLWSMKLPSGVPTSRFLMDFASNLGGQGRPTNHGLATFFGSWSQDGPKTFPKAPPGAPKTLQTMIFHNFGMDFQWFLHWFLVNVGKIFCIFW